MSETGIKRTDNGIFCEKCGADLTAEGSVRLFSHIDGRKFYANQYECVKCGAILTQRIERTGEDAEYWGQYDDVDGEQND